MTGLLRIKTELLNTTGSQHLTLRCPSIVSCIEEWWAEKDFIQGHNNNLLKMHNYMPFILPEFEEEKLIFVLTYACTNKI